MAPKESFLKTLPNNSPGDTIRQGRVLTFFYLDNTAGTDVVPAEFASVGPGEEEAELDLHADEAGLAGLQV